MERITLEPIPIVVGREEDGRWWADIESMPGVMAYGTLGSWQLPLCEHLHCAPPPTAWNTVKTYRSRSPRVFSVA
jgi:hypothetical protein